MAPGEESTAQSTADKFNHPYTPYDVQLQFMQAVYDILDKGGGQVGILESPTGTGKSLSLICATLTWLRRHKADAYESTLQIDAETAAGEPGWVLDQLRARKREDFLRSWKDREARLESARAREKAEEERAAARTAKKRRLERDGGGAAGAVDEDEWFLDEPEDGGATKHVVTGLSRVDLREEDDDGGGGNNGLESPVKIFFTSRTHSQLTQFISELRRPLFPPSIPPTLLASHDAPAEPVKVLPLSSRQKLCINPSVSSLSSLSAINDRCTELQQPKSKHKCPFVPTQANLAATHRFRDAALATLPDIEDLHRLGTQHAVCPYYASRTAIPGAEIVALPYPLLLQKSARDALGIDLAGSVVVVDEAHNIMDAVAGVHASEIKLSEIRRAKEMLGVYVRRYGKKLGGQRRVLVARVGRVIGGLREWMEGALEFKKEHDIVDVSSLLRSKGIDQINLFELIRYIHESKLAYKIEGYVSHVQDAESSTKTASSSSKQRSSTPVLHTLVSFLDALTNLSSEGRIFYHKLPPSSPSPPDMKLSYLLLSPTHAFSPLTDARALILAGGTMSPFSDYAVHLFPTLPPDRLTTLSCAHVVPPANLFVWTLTRARASDPASTFEFTYARRRDDGMVRELGLAVLNACKIVPDGVVVFFPSYGYLDEVVDKWQAAGLWDRLAARKALFRETKASNSEQMLGEYSAAILDTPPSSPTPQTGALLLSVIGGRLSEGINFSDRLGRAVMVVGLPYPNPSSPEWVAKSHYVETTVCEQLTTPGATMYQPGLALSEAQARAKSAAREFYENACLRAVNQSVGRAIRHKGDYAAIILVDRRYSADGVRSKLSGWVRESVRKESGDKGMGEMMGGLSAFFRGKKGT